ncbi:FtsW/RodA/SpoVE family cell cycle protein [Crocinitomicaceae bacterium CZZ-1]|uniref:Probable peptidoglycan glycosyltransferase FtsW n=1 Tax=Taishania pollutisoli TaxID=2766479 RepID=A0A8J6TU02_9FLAO|nr:FtsW/RodA/SpoVE family cell cycle protein [Taishania pollutisoli]MBC9813674.1 FtsW/RodA/SpoVE family cell cycle protein [Taishania pollutisoli]
MSNSETVVTSDSETMLKPGSLSVKRFLNYLKGDRVIWIITLLMLAFSLVTVFSFVPVLVKVEGGTPFKYLFKHFIYILISFAAMFWVHRQDPKYFSQVSKFALILGIGLLLLTLLLPNEVNNAKRWIRVPFIGLTFQASDFAKLALIIYLSRQLVKRKDQFKDWKEGFVPIVLPIVLVCGLIVKDNFSTAGIVFMLAIGLLFLGRFPFSRILAIFGMAIGGLFLIVLLHKAVPDLNLLPRYTTWENRILNRMDTESNVVDNAQAVNAQLAIYNGKIFGQGVGDGKLKEYLPEAYADFYYSSFVEEFGSLSAIVLTMAYLILLFRIFRIGLKAENLFETYFCIGIGMLLITQASVNMLVCTGVFPVTGQNMPLLAMGGSAMIMTCMAIGMVQSIAAKQEKGTKKTKEESGDNQLINEDE